MKYRETKLDRTLRSTFNGDMTKGHLKRIILAEGSFRGIDKLDVSFDYPITIICGKNGSGKSTITALACCAFHGIRGGYKLPKRRNSYYTFSDFFIRHPSEPLPDAIEIDYHIAYDKWYSSSGTPVAGVYAQARKKSRGGKWNDYGGRVPRSVVFLGIERVVPHAERSQSRSYNKVFKESAKAGWEQDVMDRVGRILDKKYDNFRYVIHTKYSLPIVQCAGVTYSGFNMGAGENALFDIFSVIHAAGTGAMIVIDEIELGLHLDAQRRLCTELKEICSEFSVQLICTTHSPEILASVPPEARLFVEKVNSITRVTPGVSAEFAFGELSSDFGQEVLLLVEDDVANAIVVAALPTAIRRRVTVRTIGSAHALCRQLAAAYVGGESIPVLAIFDGDQIGKAAENAAYAKRMVEIPRDDFAVWIQNRCAYLPTERHPEKWLMERAAQIPATLAVRFNCEQQEMTDTINSARNAQKHHEVRRMATRLGVEDDYCLKLLANAVVSEFFDEFTLVNARVEQKLAGER